MYFKILNFKDDSIHASMEEPSGDWPFGEELEIRATQNNRGTIQIDTGKFAVSDSRSAAMKSSFATFSVTPSVANVSPRIGSHLGGAIITISGKGAQIRTFFDSTLFKNKLDFFLSFEIKVLKIM